MSPASDRTIIAVADADEVAHTAAERIMARIAANPTRPAICLTGGSTPKHLYELLATEPYKSKIPWESIHWFIGDDRFVPLDNPLSNMGNARRLFLDRCAPAANIHAIPTDAHDPDEAARRYQAELQAFYGSHQLDSTRSLFDVVLMGMGPDGHTASLFPGAPADDRRWVVGVDKASVEPFVPRVTLTLPALAACGEMLFLVRGTDKRAILTRVLADEDLPAAQARSLAETVWIVDRAARPEKYHG